jgi:flagellar motor protein MotB
LPAFSLSSFAANFESADQISELTKNLIFKNAPVDVGVADTELLHKSDSFDASNRRIEIVVLTDDSRKKLLEQ